MFPLSESHHRILTVANSTGGLFSGKDGEAWRDDSNDLSKDTIPETFEEALLAAIAANDGKPLGSKAKKKLEKEWNAKRRQAAEIADREKRSLEGAQFAVSQSAIDEEDANWVNSLDIKIDSFSISAAGKTLFENSPLSIVHGGLKELFVECTRQDGSHRSPWKEDALCSRRF